MDIGYREWTYCTTSMEGWPVCGGETTKELNWFTTQRREARKDDYRLPSVQKDNNRIIELFGWCRQMRENKKARKEMRCRILTRHIVARPLYHHFNSVILIDFSLRKPFTPCYSLYCTFDLLFVYSWKSEQFVLKLTHWYGVSFLKTS